MGSTLTMLRGCISVIVFSACWSTLAADPDNDDQRRGKFFVSTSTYTSVVATGNICYVAVSSTGTGMLACKKRRRNLKYLNDNVISKIYPISPSPTSSDQEKQSSELSSAEISSSYADVRAARFLYYWATYTETSTSYSYTTTSTVASLFCTPNNYNVV